MKSKVMERPLFKGKKGMSMEEAQDVGIMDGFLSSVQGGDLDEKEGEGEDYETGKLMGRKPDSPEILMNNLRGDMRSIDARYEELADLVGLRTAKETPEAVLALLQPVLSQQGIGSLPAAPGAGGMPPTGAPTPDMAAMMAPTPAPGGMPPPPAEMPPEAMAGIGALPTGQEAPPPVPQGFAYGGYVQNFQQGSDEDGVTPASGPSSYVAYPPELVQKARQYLMDTTASQPITIPDLAQATAKRAKAYEQILGGGGSRELTQAQMLFDIAGGALNVAAGVDAEGRPLRGGPSAAMRAAAGLRNLPAQIGARASELSKQERAVKGAALEATEKEIAGLREYNAKVIESNRKRFADVLKSSGSSALFGKGDWQWNVVNQPGLLANWASGKTSVEQNNLIESAITTLRAPKTETRNDPVTGQSYSVVIPGVVPRFVEDAEKAHYALMGGKPPKAAATTRGGPRPTAPVTGEAPPAEVPAGGVPAPAAAPAKGKVETPNFYSSTEPTLFNLSGKGTGVVPIVKSTLEKLPLVNQFVSGSEELYATDYLNKAVDTIGKAIRVNPRFAEGERKEVEKKLDIAPQLLDNQQAYITRLMSLDDFLNTIRKGEYKKGYQSPNLGAEDIRNAREKIQDIDEIRKMIGLPPVLVSKAQWDSAPSGSVFIVKGEVLTKQ